MNQFLSPENEAFIDGQVAGLPYYTHAMGLHATTQAIFDDRDEINSSDVEEARNTVVQKTQQTITEAYNVATRSARDDVLFGRVLLACAIAAKDDEGMFAAKEVARPLSAIMNRPYDTPGYARHLKQFTEQQRGAILQVRGEARRRFYRFNDPMMQPYIILRGLSDGLITPEQLREIRGTSES